jgi:hypothetical protein
VGILRRLFGGGTGATETEDPSAALERARGDERALRRAGKRHRASFALGAPLHDAYREAWREARGSAPATPQGNVHVVHWEDFDDPSVRDVVDLCSVTEAPYLLLRALDRRADSGAGGELEALEQLEREHDVALVLVGDVDVVVRRSFLLDVLASDDVPDALEVIPELSDLANTRGLRATFVPA